MTLAKVDRKTLFRSIEGDVETVATGGRDQLNSKYSKDSWLFEQ